MNDFLSLLCLYFNHFETAIDTALNLQCGLTDHFCALD